MVKHSQGYNDGRSVGAYGGAIPQNSSDDFRKGYAISARKNHIWKAINYFLGFGVATLGVFTVSEMQKNQRVKEQRIVHFYQQNGVCPSDASPAYLDLRTQLWQRKVENNKYSEQ